MQVLGALFEERGVVGLLDVTFERGAGRGERGIDLTANELECLGSDFRHAVSSLR